MTRRSWWLVSVVLMASLGLGIALLRYAFSTEGDQVLAAALGSFFFTMPFAVLWIIARQES